MDEPNRRGGTDVQELRDRTHSYSCGREEEQCHTCNHLHRVAVVKQDPAVSLGNEVERLCLNDEVSTECHIVCYLYAYVLSRH